MNFGDTVEQLKQLRELTDDGDLLDGAMVFIERQVLALLDDVADEADARRGEPWNSAEEVRDYLEDLDAEAKAEQFERVRAALMDDIVRVFVAYNECAILGKPYTQVGEAVRQLLVSLHNPYIRETLLLAVAPEYRDDVRDWFEELAVVLYGWAETTRGERGPHARGYIRRAAKRWGIDPDDLEAQLYGDE